VTRGRLFRSPLLTFGRVAPAGVRCEWTHDLRPLGAAAVAEGEQVELHVVVEASARTVGDGTRVRFDIVAADPPADRVVTLVGTGAEPASAGAGEPRTSIVRAQSEGQAVADARAAFLGEHPGDFGEHVLIVGEGEAEPERFHLLTWWPAKRLPGRAPTRLHFTVDLDGELQAQTSEPLQVSDVPADERALRVLLRYEDEAPMAEAEFEAVFAGEQRVRGRTGADGTAEIAAPVGAGEVFRLFLLSYPQRIQVPGPPTPPEPIPPGPPDLPPLPPPSPPDTRPETVVTFAFDSAFPSPAVQAALLRVRSKAGLAQDTRLTVFGHTDKVGSVEYNVSLSQRRARALLALLLDDHEMFDEVATAEGWDTRVHQSMLRGVGCNPGAIDGNVGAMTRAATTNFQREYNRGVYHELAVVERTRSTLPEDGNLTPATRAAIRDAYVAVAPHVRADQFTDPPFEGCGKAHHVSENDDENRRAVVAFLPADTDLGQMPGCGRYDELVQETLEDMRAPHFSDYQWLREENGALHLSAVTLVPDGTAARIRVVRCEGPVPLPTPDSSGGGEPPTLGPELADLGGEIHGGICAARWTSPEPGLLDPDTWMVDHDVQLEIVDAADNEAPPPADPSSSAALLASDAVHPPMFVIRAGARWGVGGPPGARLERLRFGPDEDDPDGVTEGIGIRTDGSLVPFHADHGVVEVSATGDVMALALSEHGIAAPGGIA
jgi:outer membrane protein OmpA-like peptidoglycan-associated protein